MFHRSTPVPVNAFAWLKVISRLVTEDVSHLLTSLLNADVAVEQLKVYRRLVTEVVIHLLMSLLNFAALGLPFTTHEPPALLRYVKKAKLKSATPLTSQPPMSPHLVVAVAVS